MAGKTVKVPTCPYCNTPSTFHQSSAAFYNGRNYGPVWACIGCMAWVGCHKNSKIFAPLGRLANKELREWKIKAHAAFDPFWRRKVVRDNTSKGEARRAGYTWLAEQMGMSKKECHIGFMDVSECKRVVEICEQFRAKAA